MGGDSMFPNPFNPQLLTEIRDGTTWYKIFRDPYVLASGECQCATLLNGELKLTWCRFATLSTNWWMSSRTTMWPNGRSGSSLRGWLSYRGKAQMACNASPVPTRTIFEDNMPQERHIRMRKPYQLPGWTKNSSYYSAPAGAQTHDLQPPTNFC